MPALHQSKTTQNLVSQLTKFKEEKQQIVQKLSNGIYLNNAMIQDPASINKKYNQKTIVNRQKSIELLKKRLQHKRQADLSSDARLHSVALMTERKREELERRLDEISKRNSQRLSQLKELEENVLKKITSDIQKNEMKEKNLKQEYQRIKKDDKKIKQVKIAQKKQSFQQWKVLQGQKWKLQLLARQNQRGQKNLVEDHNPKPIKKEEKKKSEDKYIPTEREHRRLRSLKDINTKDVGNQYLEQAKMIQREAIHNNKKKKLMNLNLKVINYDKEIMDRICRNTSDLSKVEKPSMPMAASDVNSERISYESSAGEGSEVEKIIRSDFLLNEDVQTQRYLRQIRVNLNELDKFNQNKNPEEISPSSSKSRQQEEEENELLVPATIGHP